MPREAPHNVNGNATSLNRHGSNQPRSWRSSVGRILPEEVKVDVTQCLPSKSQGGLKAHKPDSAVVFPVSSILFAKSYICPTEIRLCD